MFGISYASLIDPLLRSVRQAVPDFGGMKAGQRVLDACCGTGAQAYEYALQGMMATGIDSNPNILKLSERYKDRAGGLNLSFLLADASSLPFESGSFDHASISLALHENDKCAQDAILSEMKRVVKRDGGLVFIDFSVPLPQSFPGCAVKVIEILAGAEHHRQFRQYVASGGLRPMLERHRLKPADQSWIKAGTVVMLRAVKE